MITEVKIEGLYDIKLNNDTAIRETYVSVYNGALYFSEKQDLIDHINSLNEILEYWKYDA